MELQFSAQNLKFSRISAVNGLGDENIGFQGETLELTKPEFACYLSHLKAYEALIDSGDSHGLIVEDDMVLSQNFADILAKTSFFDQQNTIVRLETPFQCTYRKPVLLGWTRRAKTGFCTLARLYSKTALLGAYVISQDLAARILRDYHQPKLAIDKLLLGKNMAHAPVVLQIDPPQAVQMRFLDPLDKAAADISDLEEARAPRFSREASQENFENFPLLKRIVLRGVRNFKGNLWHIAVGFISLFFRRKILRFSDN